jgi:hypothetical protein
MTTQEPAGQPDSSSSSGHLDLLHQTWTAETLATVQFSSTGSGITYQRIESPQKTSGSSSWFGFRKTENPVVDISKKIDELVQLELKQLSGTPEEQIAQLNCLKANLEAFATYLKKEKTGATPNPHILELVQQKLTRLETGTIDQPLIPQDILVEKILARFLKNLGFAITPTEMAQGKEQLQELFRYIIPQNIENITDLPTSLFINFAGPKTIVGKTNPFLLKTPLVNVPFQNITVMFANPLKVEIDIKGISFPSDSFAVLIELPETNLLTGPRQSAQVNAFKLLAPSVGLINLRDVVDGFSFNRDSFTVHKDTYKISCNRVTPGFATDAEGSPAIDLEIDITLAEDADSYVVGGMVQDILPFLKTFPPIDWSAQEPT